MAQKKNTHIPTEQEINDLVELMKKAEEFNERYGARIFTPSKRARDVLKHRQHQLVEGDVVKNSHIIAIQTLTDYGIDPAQAKAFVDSRGNHQLSTDASVLVDNFHYWKRHHKPPPK